MGGLCVGEVEISYLRGMKYRLFFLFFLLFSTLSFAQKQEPRLVLPVGHTGKIKMIEFSIGQKYLITSSEDNTARIWDQSLNRELYFINHKNIKNVFFYNEDKNFVSYGGGKIVFWETINGQKIDSLDGDKIVILSKDRFLIFDGDRTLIRDFKTKKIIYQFKGRCIDVSSDLSKILTVGSYSVDNENSENDSLTNVYDLNSGTKLFDFYNTSHYAYFGGGEIQKFSSNGLFIVNLKEGNNDLDIINSTTSQVLFSLKNQDTSLIITDAQISKDGKYLALAYYSITHQPSNQSYVEVINLKEKVTVFIKHNIDAYSLEFSLCSKYLISKDYEGGDNHVYDIQNEKEILFGNRALRSIQFIQNSKFISAKVSDEIGSSAQIIYDLVNPKNCYRLQENDVIYLNDGSCFIQNDRNSPSLQTFFDSKGNLIADTSKAGLGISLEIQNDYPIIKQVFRGGSVYRDSLIRINEIILAIMNEKGEFIDTKGQPLSNIIAMLKGPSGSFVTIRIQGINKNIREISVRRDITYLQPKVLINFSQYSEWINDLEMKPNSKNSYELLVACSNRKVRYLDFKSGKQLNEYQGGQDVATVNSNLKGDLFITSSTDGYVRIYNYGKSDSSIQMNYYGYTYFADFKEDVNYSEVHSADSVIWTDLTTKKVKHSAKQSGPDYEIMENSLIEKNGNINYLEFDYFNSKIQIKNVSLPDKKIDSTIIKLGIGRFEQVYYEDHFFISKDSLLIGFSTWDSTFVVLYNLRTSEHEKIYAGFDLDPRFLERGIKFLDDEYHKLIKIRNQARITHNNNRIRDVELLFDKRFLVTTAQDHKTILWDVETGKPLYTRLQLEGDDWLVYDDNYRFDGTPGAIEKLYFVCGLEVVELNQVKDSLYFPNLVQRIMNGENLDRLPKLSDLNICGVTPVVEPIDKGDGGYHYEITPRTGGVGDIEIYLNGVVRQTESAKRLKLKKGKYSIQVDPKLIERYQIPGEALQVKVIAKTANNSISSRGIISNHTVKESTSYRKPSLHAVMIGVDDYKDDNLDLNYAAKDANDLHLALEQASKKFFNVDDTNRVFFYNLTINREGKLGTDKIKGKTPDKANINQTLEEIEKKSKPEDILLVFFAGHGEIVDKDQLLLLTTEATSANFEGIRMRELLDQLNKIPAGKRVLILDACHSGAAINNMDLAKYTGKRDVKDAERQSQRLKELDKLASKSGFAIITASSSDQKALELPQYEHGLMTYALLNAMLNNKNSLDENSQLQLDKWLMATEEEVKKLNQNQSAERMVPVSFTLGKIDDEVRSSIVLKEIPTVFVENVLNRNSGKDNLNIKSSLSAAFQELSRGSSSQIMVADFPNAVKVNILYEEKGDEVKASIILYKENFEQKFELTGKKANISAFVQELMNQIRTKIQK